MNTITELLKTASVKNPLLALAPMAGYTNPEFRCICLKEGADCTYSEMVSTRGLVYGGQRTYDLMDRHEEEKNLIMQVFGDDPAIMAEAVAMVCQHGAADAIDINFGCPVKKIARSGSGAVLMKDPQKAMEITAAAVKASTLPVSIKFRLGWNADFATAREFVEFAADCGCSHMMIHGRWATQFYSGVADWDALAALVEMAKIPVFVNGDVNTAADALEIVRRTGASCIGIARGALKRPWVFREIKAAFATGQPVEERPEDFSLRVEIARWMLSETAARLKRAGVKETGSRRRGAPAWLRLRSHFMALISSVRGASKVRQAILKAESDETLDEVLKSLIP